MPCEFYTETKQILVISLVTVLCYLNSLKSGFVFDDNAGILQNRDVRPSTPLAVLFSDDFWGKPITSSSTHGSYRPLTVLTFRLNYWLSETNPKPYHLVNILIHVVATLLAWRCAALLSFSSFVAFFTAILFAVHPIHSEAVTNLVGRADLLSAVFFFLAIIFYIKSISNRGFNKVGLLLAATTCIPLASLTKETGITVAGLLVAYEICHQVKENKSSLKLGLINLLNVGSFLRLAAIATVTLAFMLVRVKLMTKIPLFTPQENPASYASPAVRRLTYAYLIPLNAQFLLYPWALSADWSMGSIRLIEGFTDYRNLFTVLFFVSLFAGLVAIIKSKRFDLHVAFCLAFVIVPLIPASNLFFQVGFVLAERILYLPSFGCCALVAIGLERLWLVHPTKRRSNNNNCQSVSAIASAIALAFFLRTVLRNNDWTNEEIMNRSGIRFNPNNAKFYFSVGLQYANRQQFPEAFAYIYKAVRTPSPFYFYIRAHHVLPEILGSLNEPKFMEIEYRRHLLFLTRPSTSDSRGINFDAKINALMQLANILSDSTTYSRLVEADNIWDAMLSEYQLYISGFERRGEVLYKLRRFDEARNLFSAPLQVRKNCANCHYNLAIVDLTKSPTSDENTVKSSLGLLEKAIRLDPGHYYAMHAFSLVVLTRKMSTLYDQAKNYTRQVVEAERKINHTLTKGIATAITLPESAIKASSAAIVGSLLELESDGNYETALDYWQEALYRNGNSKAREMAAFMKERSSPQSNESLAKIEKLLLAKYETNSDMWLLFGYFCLENGADAATIKNAFNRAGKVDDEPDRNFLAK